MAFYLKDNCDKNDESRMLLGKSRWKYHKKPSGFTYDYPSSVYQVAGALGFVCSEVEVYEVI